jgi:hypothetical protein
MTINESTRGKFGNPEEGEDPPTEAVTKGLVNTVTEDSRVHNSDL